MKSLEIVLRELSNHENCEVVKEKRIMFIRHWKLEELKSDQGLLGDLLRESSE